MNKYDIIPPRRNEKISIGRKAKRIEQDEETFRTLKIWDIRHKTKSWPYFYDSALSLWNGSNWLDILSTDRKPISDNMGNLRVDFYTGDVEFCNPEIKIVSEFDYTAQTKRYSDFFTPRITDTLCDKVIRIDKYDCDRQKEEGVFNYYCFLKSAVEKARLIKQNYPEINVYISLSNDHVFPVLPLTRIRIEGKNIIEKLRSECPECKFTNGMAWNMIKFTKEDEYPGHGILYDNEDTYKTLLIEYLDSIGDMSFGINAYASGNCINSYENGDTGLLKKRFCETYSGYVDDIWKRDGNNFYIKKFYEDYYAQNDKGEIGK
ncbi:MAG: hypothetical protein ACP5QK_13170, partial [Myxococcota bacterium]